MPEHYHILNNKDLMHFEIHEGNDIAFLEYRFYKKDIAFMHTEVPDSMGGKGIASKLAAYAFKYAKDNDKPVMVYCPFVAAFIKRHPEYRDQLDKEFHH
jgi:predicted GNAT family acetyltransferase